MLENEQHIIENLPVPYNKYYVPFVWAATLVVKARKQGRINDDYTVQTILDVITVTTLHVLTHFHALMLC